MAAHIGYAVFDALAPTPKIGWAQFDAKASRPSVGWVEFDVRVNPNDNHDAAEASDVTGGRARRTSVAKATSTLKSSPQVDASHYHSRAYEQDERAAAELDDEETVIAYLMELALHV